MDRGIPFHRLKKWATWLSDAYRDYDRRRNVRLPAEVEVVLTLPAGTLEARSINVSKGGVSVLATEAIACGTLVFVRFPTIDRSGFAHVRRCAPRGDRYELALVFRDGLKLDDRALSGFDYRRTSAPGSWNDADR